MGFLNVLMFFFICVIINSVVFFLDGDINYGYIMILGFLGKDVIFFFFV